MNEYTTQVGMDVHARSVSCKALKGAGEHTNVAKVAVVSELVRWMWAMGLQVQREQAAA